MRGVKTGESPTMENHADISPGEQFAAAIAWWRDAGVDFDYADMVEPLLGEAPVEKGPAPQVAAAKEEKPPEPGITAEDLPQTLADFREWWVGPDNPLIQGQAPRIAPVGTANAPVMVISAMPEAQDRETLLSGPQGVLIGNILRAANIDPKLAYLASALPCHLTLPGWDELGTQGLGTVLAHHVALAGPRKVLLMGSRLPALLGHSPDAPPESFAAIGETPALATFAPDRLLDHARQRARLWKRFCEWIVTA